MRIYVSVFMPFVLLINYLKTFLLYDSFVLTTIIPSFFGCYKLGISMSSLIYHSFSENCTIRQFGNIFYEIFFFNFVLALCLYQCIILTKLLDWIKWNIYFWTFFNTNLWFNACFRFPMCITYSFLWRKLATFFFHFHKIDKSLWRSCNFLWYWTSASRKYPLLLSPL